MKNNLKNIFIVVIMCITIMLNGLTVSAELFTENPSVNKIKTEFATKAPFGKRQLAMKFILAMLGVATSSVIIYVILSLYNKFLYKDTTTVLNEEDNDFKTPTNMKEAINIFLKKTK